MSELHYWRQTACAALQTDRGARYMMQLCRHFGHRHEVAWNETSGVLKFPFGSCKLETDESTLSLVVEAPDSEGLERVKRVVGSHLERFGHREQLTVAWHNETRTKGGDAA